MVNTKEDEATLDKPKKLDFVATWREITRKQHTLMVALIIMIVMSLAFLIFALIAIRPQGAVVIVGYSDVYGDFADVSGGYRRDSWLNMLAFPILAVVFGVIHAFIALRVYRKYGKFPALVVVIATILLIVGAFVVLLRLLGEW